MSEEITLREMLVRIGGAIGKAYTRVYGDPRVLYITCNADNYDPNPMSATWDDPEQQKNRRAMQESEERGKRGITPDPVAYSNGDPNASGF